MSSGIAYRIRDKEHHTYVIRGPVMALAAASSSKDTLEVLLEFGGGTELLLRPPRSKKQRVTIPAYASATAVDHLGRDGSLAAMSKPPAPVITAPSGNQIHLNENEAKMLTGAAAIDQPRPADMRFLVQWILHNLVAERGQLFVDTDGEGIRPGILVLINDADWELEGELDYVLQNGDEICFISTLHGG